MSSSEFKTLAIRKLTENFLSIKVWIIFTYMAGSAFLVMSGFMTGDAFAASNGGIISTVLAIREGVKVAKIQKGSASKASETMT